MLTSSQVISGLTISNKSPLADGTTIVYLSVKLNNQADPDKTTVIFETSAGQFLTSAMNDTLVTQPGVYLADGSLVASIGLKMPITACKIYLSVRAAAASQQQNFVLRDTLTAVPSLPASLVLTPSALGIKTDFGSEVQLSALLRNAEDDFVSTGAKVLFEDYLAGGVPAKGEFRAIRDTTDATSTVSAVISGGFTSGEQFYIKCTYLDAAGNRTAVKDSCLINVQ